MPTKETKLIEWSGNLIDVAAVNKTLLGLLDEQLADLTATRGQFITLHDKCQTPDHTPFDVHAKNDLADVSVAALAPDG
jgi:hypothetical protein